MPTTSFGPYQLTRTLGEGEFGKVKLAIHSVSRKSVAIKLIRKDSLTQSHRHAKLLREIKILKVCLVSLMSDGQSSKHCQTHRSHRDGNLHWCHYGICVWYCCSTNHQGGELFEHILARKYLKEPEARHFFAQLVRGLRYLHLNKIVHRDLKLVRLSFS